VNRFCGRIKGNLSLTLGTATATSCGGGTKGEPQGASCKVAVGLPTVLLR